MEEQENTNSINGLLLNDESKVSDSTLILKEIKWIPFFIGIAVFLLGLVDMIVFYIIPNLQIAKNKHEYPYATFDKPNNGIIALHFSLHASIIISGVFLVLLGIKSYLGSIDKILFYGLIIAPSLVFLLWFVEVIIGFTFTKDPPSNKSIDQIQPYLVDEHPVNFAFIYSSDFVVIPNCYRNQATGQYECTHDIEPCYSRTGISIPFVSQLVSSSYNFANSPDIFKFTIDQVINMTKEYETKFRTIMWNLDNCDERNKVVDYYPLIAGNYVVTNNLPSWCTHKTRIISILFGLSAYYELYVKSIPSINHKQLINIDVVPNFDYESLWNDTSCIYYGKCNMYNSKPTPDSK